MAIPSRRAFYEACERYDEKCKITGNPTIAEIVEKLDRRRIYPRITPNAETVAAMNEPRDGRKRYTDIDELMRDLARPGWLVWVRRLLGRVG